MTKAFADISDADKFERIRCAIRGAQPGMRVTVPIEHIQWLIDEASPEGAPAPEASFKITVYAATQFAANKMAKELQVILLDSHDNINDQDFSGPTRLLIEGQTNGEMPSR